MACLCVSPRFRPTHDFGYVALDILDVIEEDSGVYTCRAVNSLGTDEFQLRLNCESNSKFLWINQILYSLLYANSYFYAHFQLHLPLKPVACPKTLDTWSTSIAVKRKWMK